MKEVLKQEAFQIILPVGHDRFLQYGYGYRLGASSHPCLSREKGEESMR
jgi:hypothetical protein